MSATLPHAARTDVGQRREHNEDSLVADPPLFAIADGVGGSARGEVASRLAIDALTAAAGDVAAAPTADDAVRAMEHAVLRANSAVHDAQVGDGSLRGMATTVTAAVVRSGGEVIVGHVGDSRLYVLSAAGARMVTADHSVVAELVRSGRIDAAEAATHPQRNVITRALGPEPDVSVDAFVLHVGPGDWILACSDGLTEHVDDDELARALVEGGADPGAALDRLVDQANARGGTDNISVVVAQPVPSDVSGELRVEAIAAAASATTTSIPAQSEVREPSAVEASGELPAMQPMVDDVPYHDPHGALRSHRSRRRLAASAIAVLGVAAGAFLWSQSYFLVERTDGQIGVDRGFPFAGLSSPYRSSDIAASELSSSDRARLVDTRHIRSRDDALRILDGLDERVGTTDRPDVELEASDGESATA